MRKIPDIIKIARRKLRDNQTDAEIKVWNEIRAKRHWYKFQRQFPIFVFTEDSGQDRYIIADFYCSELKIIIELDWDIHNRKDIYELDRIKEEFLQNQWLRILRFTNKKVLNQSNLKKYIWNILQSLALVKSKDSGKSLWSGSLWIDSELESTEYLLSKKRFTMINDSFTCENCNTEITKHPTGSARNHCPNCLYSKHLDQDFPWDRLSECYGLMKPVWLDYRKNKGLMIEHECQKCSKKILNRIAPDDNQEIIRGL